MPDLQNFSINPIETAAVEVPRYRIEGLVCDSNTGEILGDYTGDNALYWPDLLARLSEEEQLQVVLTLTPLVTGFRY